MIHSNEKEIKWQEAHMDEQGAPDKTQTSKGSTQEVEAWPGDLEGNRKNVQICSYDIRKTKVHLEINLSGDMQSKTKCFYKCISSKTKIGKMWACC